jgi:hypothetical protein
MSIGSANAIRAAARPALATGTGRSEYVPKYPDHGLARGRLNARTLMPMDCGETSIKISASLQPTLLKQACRIGWLCDKVSISAEIPKMVAAVSAAIAAVVMAVAQHPIATLPRRLADFLVGTY